MSKFWPVPDSASRSIPQAGERGAFWENRGDRRHAGVDLYAPAGCPVLAIEAGEVLQVEEFTSPHKISYWNITYSVLIRTRSGALQRYAEMEQALVQPGESVSAGQIIGRVGLVLNLDLINETSPAYIQRLKQAGAPSMLHFEMHTDLPDTADYLGGNYFTQSQPSQLLDPTPYLQDLARTPENEP